MLTISRRIALGVAIFMGLATLGGVFFSIQTSVDEFISITCLTAGLTLTAFLWWLLAEVEYKSQSAYWIIVNIALIGGAALYTNLTYSLYSLGVPFNNLGATQTGKISEMAWMGPLMLAFAAFNYAYLRTLARK